MKVFNTTAVCIPSKHYMVDLSDKVREIKKLVDAGKYFIISRPRQYGKTTMLNILKHYLQADYDVISLSFEDIGEAEFQSEYSFVIALCEKLNREFRAGLSAPNHIKDQISEYISRNTEKAELDELFETLLEWCEESTRKMVLIIDEVDNGTGNQVFLDFLSQLRDGYIRRETDGMSTFHSVILAGVTDIKHLKSRIRDDDQHKVNSPWNIAADFNVDMSLSEDGIRGMLDEYEADHHTGMNTAAIAKMLREYTNGYPFLVSRICQLLDENVRKTNGLQNAWTKEGVNTAIKILLSEKNPLFESVTGKLTNYPELCASIRSILMEGTKLTYNPQQEEIVQLEMYGLIRNEHNTVRVSNRIFETMLYNLFLSDEELKSSAFSREGELERNIFITDVKLNMRRILKRFISSYQEICGPLKDKFTEKDGREQFLLYLKPIINGTGNYYIEAQTRDQTRTDVIIDYLGQQYIIELKIWRGERYNVAGEKQISEYLDYFGLSVGYMLSFNFNQKKETGVRRIQIADKVLYEGTV